MLIEVLEPRQLLAAAYPTDLEQYFVELTNRARMNPTAEAKRFGIDLNEGLAPGTLASTPRQPLAINPFLTSAARKYSTALLNPPTGANPNKGQLDHLLNGTTPWGRAQAEGYPSGLVSENLVWSSKSNTTATMADVEKGHELLFKDFTASFEVVGRGHRKNILNGDRKEIGIGLVVGPFGNWTAHVGTQDFGTNGPGVFLTGVVFTDKVVDNDFYTPGEGIGGITIKAVRSTDKKAFSTKSWASGGYSLGIEAGVYTVTASGSALGTTQTLYNVIVSKQNVKVDFIKPGNADQTAPTVTLIANTLAKPGTSPHTFTVTYRDMHALKAASIGNGDILVTGAGFSMAAKLVNKTPGTDGVSIVATYCIGPRGAAWDAADNGVYAVKLAANQVSDAAGKFAAATTLGSFRVAIT